ncbi:MAG: HAMP domain-containing histidine kinase [Candidatus Obscuribacterales bacterium]|nr:HAMP domain-containing histidine kinase [Candidatus Obscuribacterales bacterium]
MQELSHDDLLAKSKQLIYFRFAFAVVALCFVFLVGHFVRIDLDPLALSGTCIFVVCVNAVGYFLLKQDLLPSEKTLNGLNAVLLSGDIVAISCAVHLTKGAESDLFFLYLLPILLASNVFGRIGIFLTALFASSAYVAVLLVANWSFLPFAYVNVVPESLSAAYAHRLLGQIVSRSGILFILSIVWAAFCLRMSGIDQDTKLRLEEQLRANTAKNLELRQIQSQLIHQEKMASLGRIVAGIAHELNNPINFVHGNLPYLREYFEDLKKLVASFDQIGDNPKIRVEELKREINYDFLVTDLDNIIADLNEGAERVRLIVRNLRSFSRLDEAELKEASIVDGLESTIKILSQYYGQDKIALETSYAQLPLVLCYPGKLNQVWMNLLSNAAQAVSQVPNPKVVIATELLSDWIIVSVGDNGPGIKESDQSKIFEPFFTTKPVGQGTGLGLSICHSIIERHGGQIWFESEPEKGTKFFVKIPIKAVVDLNEPGQIEPSVT